MMKKLSTLLLLVVLQSCGLIEINGNGYRYLKFVSKSHILPFHSAKDYNVDDNQSCFKVFEINNENFQSAFKSNELTWVHLWKPYCGNESCTNINQYSDLKSRIDDDRLKLLFVSVAYDMNSIAWYLSNSNFKEIVYVLEDEYYGSKTKWAYQKLHLDFDKTADKDDHFFHDNYLFMGDSLIYKGDKINDSIISSYIRNS